jgi:hypothetical protein
MRSSTTWGSREGHAANDSAPPVYTSKSSRLRHDDTQSFVTYGAHDAHRPRLSPAHSQQLYRQVSVERPLWQMIAEAPF